MTEDLPILQKIRKNVNVYYLLATSLAVWFLFIHSPPILIARKVWNDAPFLIHLFGAYSIYLACVCNTLVTPSVKKSLHIWVGRFGMVMGVVGFVAGVYICYWPWRNPLPPLGFSIGVTIGGTIQVFLQYQGYKYIKEFQRLREQLTSPTVNSNEVSTPLLQKDREELEEKKKAALQGHIASMIALFIIACGIPAAMRVLEKIGAEGGIAIPVVVALFNVVGVLYVKAIIARL